MGLRQTYFAVSSSPGPHDKQCITTTQQLYAAVFNTAFYVFNHHGCAYFTVCRIFTYFSPFVCTYLFSLAMELS